MTDIWSLLGGHTFAERLAEDEEKDDRREKAPARRAAKIRKTEPRRLTNAQPA